ncbi:hypothetical protein J6590_097445 [Homalodisca vitripennis]|nr:hypothetical protein J6590_097445 [Homalodisca vitripennis]
MSTTKKHQMNSFSSFSHQRQLRYKIKCNLGDEVFLLSHQRVPKLSQDNRIKQRRARLLLVWVTAERSCLIKQLACPAIGGGSEVIFKPLVPRLSVREGFLALTSPGIIRH